MTDYDVENPVTQRNGFNRLLNLKKKARGEEVEIQEMK